VRPATVDDAAAWADIFRHESVVWGTMQMPTVPTAVFRQKLAMPPPHRFYSFAAEVGGRLAGNLGLAPPTRPRRLHATHLGMGVHPDFQGMGVGDALLRAGLDLADGWLRCERVELEVYPDNTRARRLYEKHGFVEEGVRRYAVFRDGAYVDSVVMGRCRP
jgi:putative acetyltransferase